MRGTLLVIAVLAAAGALFLAGRYGTLAPCDMARQELGRVAAAAGGIDPSSGRIDVRQVPADMSAGDCLLGVVYLTLK